MCIRDSVNTLLLLLVAWLSTLIGFGLQIDTFWSGFWGALVLAIISFLIGLIFRPLLVSSSSARR